MDEHQIEIWEALCGLSGEEVARLFTNYHGNQLLSKDFKEYLQDEGWIEPDEDDETELPTQVMEYVTNISEDWYDLDEEERDNAINDYLSNEFEYCTNGFDYEVVGFRVYIKNIKWDKED